jgi:hypothetical protein
MTDQEVQAAMNEAFKEAEDNAYFGNGFLAGVQFAKKQVLEELKAEVEAVKRDVTKEAKALDGDDELWGERIGYGYVLRLIKGLEG